MRHLLLALLATLTVAPTIFSQAAPVRPLGRMEAEFAEPFSVISSARELRDGRVIVVDTRERTVQILDAKLSAAQPVGREGRGPNEYATPSLLVAARADSSLLLDAGAFRFLVIDPAGKPVSTISFAGPGGMPVVIPTGVRGVDAQGRIYFQSLGFAMAASGPQFSDSSMIIRWDVAKKAIDTLARVAAFSPRMQLSGNPAAGGSVKMQTPAYPVVDEWALLSDGTIAIVRGRDYRVELLAPGGTTAGRPIPYQRVKVTDEDRKELREARQRAQQAVARAAGEARAAMGAQGRQGAAPSIQLDEPTDWPEFKPPFPQGAVRASHDGKLWVALSRPAGEAPLYDVLDRTGQLLYRVALPKKSAIVGFGAGTVYVVRRDDDDLQYLQRYRM